MVDAGGGGLGGRPRIDKCPSPPYKNVQKSQKCVKLQKPQNLKTHNQVETSKLTIRWRPQNSQPGRVLKTHNQVETSKLTTRWRPQNSQPGGDLKTHNQMQVGPLKGGDLKPCEGSNHSWSGLQPSRLGQLRNDVPL